jgi:Flp pilus assembly protein TadG
MTRRGNHGRRWKAWVRGRLPRSNERGAAAVEFALVAPLLLVLVFGIIDFGMLMNTKTVIANAAREGARDGSISHSVAVIDSSVDAALGNIPAANVTITVGCIGPAPTYTVCPAGGFDANVKSGGTLQVTVKYHYNWITPLPSLIGLGNNNGKDVIETVDMRVE